MTDGFRDNEDVDGKGGAGTYTSTDYGSDEDDWTKWGATDWKKYKAAIVGSSAVEEDNAAQGDIANGLIDPNTLVEAANTFNQTQMNLASVAENLRQQARGLAGEGRPWQGKAAEAFLAKMETMSQYLDSQAERINGGSTTLGAHSVPSQLYNSGNVLAWAQQSVNYIDSYYAAWAGAHGAKTYDGLVHVSEIKGLPEKITEDMKKVMSQLVGQYKMNVDAVVQPSPTGPDTSVDISVPSLSDYSIPEISTPNFSYPDISTPNFSFPDQSYPNFSYPDVSTPNLSLPPGVSLPPGTDIPPPTGNIPPPGGNVPPPGGGVLPPGTNVPPPNLQNPPGLDTNPPVWTPRI